MKNSMHCCWQLLFCFLFISALNEKNSINNESECPSSVLHELWLSHFITQSTRINDIVTWEEAYKYSLFILKWFRALSWKMIIEFIYPLIKYFIHIVWNKCSAISRSTMLITTSCGSGLLLWTRNMCVKRYKWNCTTTTLPHSLTPFINCILMVTAMNCARQFSTHWENDFSISKRLLSTEHVVILELDDFVSISFNKMQYAATIEADA